MSFRGLVSTFCRRFSHSKVNVILIKDHPNLGFEGQIVKVKPGFASMYLVPRQIAVLDFPCLHERLFPDWDETQIEKKKERLQLKGFLSKISNLSVEIKRLSSTTNPTFLRESLKVRDIIEQVQSSLNMELQPQNVQFLTDIDRYGTYLVKVEDYYSDKFDRKFSFRLKVNVKREFAKGEKSEIEFNQDEFREVDEKKKKKKKK